MKINAPVSRLEEIAPLAEAGADEFYCSVVPPSWAEKFQTSAISRRAFANLADMQELTAAVTQTHQLGKQLSLAMNAQHYTGEQLECLLELAAEFDRLGGDAVIVGDESLLFQLAGQGFDFAIHLSSIGACRNSHAVAFHNELGAERIILPRDVKLREIERMRKQSPDIQIEAFMLNDGCTFEEGVCHTIHLPDKFGGPICLDDYHHDHRRRDAQPLTQEEQDCLEENEKQYQQWLWYRFGCGFSVTRQGYPYGPCALCAIPRLHTCGVDSIKIAGRDAPTARKVKSVEMVSRVRAEFAQNGAEAAVAHARDLRGEAQHCESGFMCYYPESRPRQEQPHSRRIPLITV